MALTKDQIKKYSGSALLVLGALPPFLAAIGALWPPAAVAGLAIQELLGLYGTIQPGLVQAVAFGSGGYLLKESKPANLSIPEAQQLLMETKFKEEKDRRDKDRKETNL